MGGEAMSRAPRSVRREAWRKQRPLDAYNIEQRAFTLTLIALALGMILLIVLPE